MPPFARTVLYYPTIEIPTGPWLRQALLYWDHVGSIVPRSFDEWQDSRAVARYSSKMQYLHGEGVFQPYNPDYLVMEGPEGHERMLNELKQIIGDPSFQKLITPLPQRVLDVRIYPQKVSGSIASLLEGKGLVRYDSREHVYFFEKLTAYLFMSLLAKHLASVSEEIVIPSTDHRTFEQMTFRGVGVLEKEIALSAVLHEVLPVPAPNVKLRRIIQFRRRHQLQLEEFRVELEQFEEHLRSCEHERQVRDQVVQFRLRLTTEVGKLEREFRQSVIPFVMSSLQSFIKPTSPTLLGAALVLAGKATSLTTVPVEWVLGGAAGAGLIEVGALWTNKWQSRQNEINRAPFSYLYRAKGKVSLKMTKLP